MFCNKCGTQLPDNSSFCSRCGVHIGVAFPPSQEQSSSFLSRKQFYTSSPQNQKLYEKQRLWSILGAAFMISNVIMFFMLPPLMVLTSILGVTFLCISIGPSQKLNRMYKEYIIQYQNQTQPPVV